MFCDSQPGCNPPPPSLQLHRPRVKENGRLSACVSKSKPLLPFRCRGNKPLNTHTSFLFFHIHAKRVLSHPLGHHKCWDEEEKMRTNQLISRSRNANTGLLSLWEEGRKKRYKWLISMSPLLNKHAFVSLLFSCFCVCRRSEGRRVWIDGSH